MPANGSRGAGRSGDNVPLWVFEGKALKVFYEKLSQNSDGRANRACTDLTRNLRSEGASEKGQNNRSSGGKRQRRFYEWRKLKGR